ncbi:MAG: hypothetical protein COZ20_03375 [Gallionellales bacterium CG_4_10_14_3_um_filter_54_96]|nr:MAG: hypothetical protein COS43_01690 [Gallionellales bacterium CG03_land_8_20_14_0_80_55_15]PIV91050.1 MAG: hypothetical protein COW45_08015 [Gallionellales bacterium CG17_big_fil_post_rev_8_21_14_2_50_54_146]PIX03616.1 MAG: hypothetical protein COZ77_10835 [Gallionellales bacterium CG_4_8_14_3_um_filter_54_18]PIY05421.1 MAG: hypothetical protein COZ20_03375 [Gallionellales bacterium CG_4_10_14_3_um_filter_54_96]PJC03283.1 MAG: hypothetical protein CO070_08875 [Gallionellales bacterium CG_4
MLPNSPKTDLIASICADTPHWASHTLKAWDENDFRAKQPFVNEKYWSSQHSINVFEVVGTAHPDYQGMCWLEFLEKGKRMRQNLQLQQSNPIYYLDEAVKLPTMYYIEIDNSGWHINGDGNHRTCIARFMFQGLSKTMLHGVNVESYRTDQQAFNAFNRLRIAAAIKNLPWIIESKRKTISREDTAGWMRERYAVSICINDLKNGILEELSVVEAIERADKIERTTKSLLASITSLLSRKKGS